MNREKKIQKKYVKKIISRDTLRCKGKVYK